MSPQLRIIFLGLSITSSWGNGHATTYRSLLGALARRGHDVSFLERDTPWYAKHRDLRAMPEVRIALYDSIADLRDRFGSEIGNADAVVVGSYVPEALEIGSWITRQARGVVAFYDIDTPITLAKLEAGEECEYVSRALLERYHLYLSFSGGPALRRLEALGAACALPLFCAVDPQMHHPIALEPPRWDLGYLGTYAEDRQAALNELMLDVADRIGDLGRFAVAGPLYPPEIAWPANVERIEHLPPAEHSRFYNRQRFTLNLTRADMKRLGYSPSVRLFEAAACGATIISDVWEGLSALFEPFHEMLPATSGHAVESYLRDLPESTRLEIGARARRRVLASHTADHRAETFERYVSPQSDVEVATDASVSVQRQRPH
jgi:spore maturation protein CgeB